MDSPIQYRSQTGCDYIPGLFCLVLDRPDLDQCPSVISDQLVGGSGDYAADLGSALVCHLFTGYGHNRLEGP